LSNALSTHSIRVSNQLVVQNKLQFFEIDHRSGRTKQLNRLLRHPFDEYRHGPLGQNRDRKNEKKYGKGGIKAGQIWDNFFQK